MTQHIGKNIQTKIKLSIKIMKTFIVTVKKNIVSLIKKSINVHDMKNKEIELKINFFHRKHSNFELYFSSAR